MDFFFLMVLSWGGAGRGGEGPGARTSVVGGADAGEGDGTAVGSRPGREGWMTASMSMWDEEGRADERGREEAETGRLVEGPSVDVGPVGSAAVRTGGDGGRGTS